MEAKVDPSLVSYLVFVFNNDSIRMNWRVQENVCSHDRTCMFVDCSFKKTWSPFDKKKFECLWLFRKHREHFVSSPMLVLAGATRPHYAPEPLDVGWLLRADLTMPDGKKESVFTTGPLDAGTLLVWCINFNHKELWSIIWSLMHCLFIIMYLQLLDLETMWRPCLRKAVASSM